MRNRMVKIHRSVSGILLLDKPIGITSNGALQRVKRLFNAKKAGHTGSLDPLATGMLPICLGEATKLSSFLLDSNKSYKVTAKLGVRTNTGDCEGHIIETRPVEVTHERLLEIIQKFLGNIEQIPPMFSAIKVEGRPLYELARKGIEIERAPRQVNIFSIKLDEFLDDVFSFHVHCSKGTYVRTLVEDIGHALGCGAHVTELRRTQVFPYHQSNMHTMDELEKMGENFTALDRCLLSMDTAIDFLPAIQLTTAMAFYLRNGQSVRVSISVNSTYVRLMSEVGNLIGIGEYTVDGRIKPYRLLN